MCPVVILQGRPEVRSGWSEIIALAQGLERKPSKEQMEDRGLPRRITIYPAVRRKRRLSLSPCVDVLPLLVKKSGVCAMGISVLGPTGQRTFSPSR